MRKIQSIHSWLLLAAMVSGSLFSCSDNGGGGNGSGFDRGGMLANYADNLIIPALNSLNTELGSFKNNYAAYKLGNADLASLQDDWKMLATAWQAASFYNFGPTSFPWGTLDRNIGGFPTDTVTLLAKLANGDTSTTDLERDTRGIHAMEYLLFVKLDSTHASSDSISLLYLERQIDYCEELLAAGLNRWVSTYRDSFVANTATTAEAPTTLLYNSILMAYEDMKRFKVAIPAGLQAGQDSALPQFVEAFYSGESVNLLQEQLEAFDAAWRGNAGTTAGLGMDDLLLSAPGGDALLNNFDQQVAVIRSALNSLPDKELSTMIAEDFNTVRMLSDDMQALVRYIKSDFVSLTGLTVTFSDSDGD